MCGFVRFTRPCPPAQAPAAPRSRVQDHGGDDIEVGGGGLSGEDAAPATAADTSAAVAAPTDASAESSGARGATAAEAAAAAAAAEAEAERARQEPPVLVHVLQPRVRA